MFLFLILVKTLSFYPKPYNSLPSYFFSCPAPTTPAPLTSASLSPPSRFFTLSSVTHNSFSDLLLFSLFLSPVFIIIPGHLFSLVPLPLYLFLSSPSSSFRRSFPSPCSSSSPSPGLHMSLPWLRCRVRGRRTRLEVDALLPRQGGRVGWLGEHGPPSRGVKERGAISTCTW